MAGKNTAAFGIFSTRLKVEETIDALKAAGYRNTDLSVLCPHNEGSKDIAAEKHTKAPEAAAAGASAGALVGGALGWVAGIGLLTVPGVGPFLAAGPIMAALAGVGIGGAVGGIGGALIGLGMPEYQAKRYEGRIRKGGILLSVHCDNAEWTKKAEGILKDYGAEDISSTAEAKADYETSDRPHART